MRRAYTALGIFLTVLLAHGPAQAVVIEFSAAAMRPPIGSSIRGQNLENQINSQILAPGGLGSIEFGATDGGTTAVDSMAFEGSGPAGGLTVITGFGFIYRFDAPVSNVRVRFTNFKDDDTRWLYGFDQDVSYVREDPLVANNQHVLGNPINFPDFTTLAIDSATGVLPPGRDDFMDLSVSGDISSILVRSNKFLWTLREIEFEASTEVPEPAAIALFGVGLAGLGIARRRRRQGAGAVVGLTADMKD